MEHFIEIIKTNSKKPKIAHIGYLHHFQKDVLKTSLDIEKPIFISIDHDHVHTSNKNSVAALKLQNKMNEKAQIYPMQHRVKYLSSLGYNDPSKPAFRKELVIEGEWCLYGEERFLLDDNGPDANERVLIFATDTGLSLLVISNTWFIDGNFGLALEYFKQLYVFRVQKNSFFITAVYCILEPVMNAAKLILGSHITIRGCFYYLCQSTYRKLQELGLSERYKTDEAFRKFCTMVDSLTFLPLDDVKNGMKWLKKNIPTRAEDFIIYFDTTYVNGSFKRIGTNDSNIRLRRIPPVFPPCTWNVHQTTLSNDDIWHLIRKIKYEVALDYAKLALDDVGETNIKTTKLGQMRTMEIR
ncbi:Uncharacterized protein FWK35_00009199 [Aphis craccivora]|uniref:MULE domain-containing protein n=1 Tax=Aphis craccivora TaxID=307492 RepID=A0A6G0YK58_APHCR|nr:Uncharacterized protein FWK35_00009199 [Aphis craccivora]